MHFTFLSSPASDNFEFFYLFIVFYLLFIFSFMHFMFPCSPASDNFEETLSTLRYADRAKQIVNHAVVNEVRLQFLIENIQGNLDINQLVNFLFGVQCIRMHKPS